MVKKLQTSWYSQWELKETAETRHGGNIGVGKRKIKRPLDVKRPVHLVLRSSKAKGELNFLRPKNKRSIDLIIKRQSERFGIKIERFANVGNHFHFMLRFRHREYFQNFLRTITTLIARAITGAKKGLAYGRFWDALAFSRVLTSKYEEPVLRSYIDANCIEVQHGAEIRREYLIRASQLRRRKWRDRI